MRLGILGYCSDYSFRYWFGVVDICLITKWYVLWQRASVFGVSFFLRQGRLDLFRITPPLLTERDGAKTFDGEAQSPIHWIDWGSRTKLMCICLLLRIISANIRAYMRVRVCSASACVNSFNLPEFELPNVSFFRISRNFVISWRPDSLRTPNRAIRVAKKLQNLATEPASDWAVPFRNITQDIFAACVGEKSSFTRVYARWK